MEKIRNGLIRFMYGRSGPDSLYKASLVLYFILAVINMFAGSTILWLAMTALFIWSMFRCFSRNVYKRQQENIRYLQIKDKTVKKFRMYKTMLTDKEHSYKKCSHCKQILRLPKKKGEHGVVCPKCHEKTIVKIR